MNFSRKKHLIKVGRHTLPLFVAALLMTDSRTHADEQSKETLYIITNRSVSIDDISVSDVVHIFKKDKTQIGGVKVFPFHASKNSPLRAAFLSKVMNMSLSDETRYWEIQKIQNGRSPPSEVRDTLKAVFTMKKGISYCFASQYKENIAKILLKL